jgi:CDP-diacylglycerol--serine O-phosphatidyltransferase
MARIPLKYLAPNAITCASMTLGMVSIFHAIAGEYVTATWLILLCVLFDKADGSVARALNASSEFGIQLDSFSDSITFGVAPAVLIHQMLSDPTLGGGLFVEDRMMMWILRLTVVLYVLAGCLRLAKFNVMAVDQSGPGHFLGFPTTLCGALLGAWILTSMKYDWPVVTLHILPGVLAALSFLMVSNLPLPKARLPKSRVLRMPLIAAVVSIYYCGLTWTAPEFLLGISSIFTLGGLIYGALYLRPSASNPSDDDGELDSVEEIA